MFSMSSCRKSGCVLKDTLNYDKTYNSTRVSGPCLMVKGRSLERRDTGRGRVDVARQ